MESGVVKHFLPTHFMSAPSPPLFSGGLWCSGDYRIFIRKSIHLMPNPGKEINPGGNTPS